MRIRVYRRSLACVMARKVNNIPSSTNTNMYLTRTRKKDRVTIATESCWLNSILRTQYFNFLSLHQSPNQNAESPFAFRILPILISSLLCIFIPSITSCSLFTDYCFGDISFMMVSPSDKSTPPFTAKDRLLIDCLAYLPVSALRAIMYLYPSPSVKANDGLHSYTLRVDHVSP